MLNLELQNFLKKIEKKTKAKIRINFFIIHWEFIAAVWKSPVQLILKYAFHKIHFHHPLILGLYFTSIGTLVLVFDELVGVI